MSDEDKKELFRAEMRILEQKTIASNRELKDEIIKEIRETVTEATQPLKKDVETLSEETKVMRYIGRKTKIFYYFTLC